MKLTTNFRKSEFDSKDGAEMPAEVLTNINKLAANLQVLRDRLGVPIRVNSGYRSPSHNAAVKGARFSQHLLGTAADIAVSGYTTKKVAEVIEELIKSGLMKEGGLKAYNTFVHYDIRGVRARW